MQQTTDGLSAPHLRGELARANLHRYEIAPAARMHPRTIGELLNGRRLLTAKAAERILQAIREVELQKRSAAR